VASPKSEKKSPPKNVTPLYSGSGLLTAQSPKVHGLPINVPLSGLTSYVPTLRLSDIAAGYGPSDITSLSASSGILNLLDPPSEQIRKLERDVAKYREELNQQRAALHDEKQSREQLEAKLEQFKKTQGNLRNTEELTFILARILPALHAKLMASEPIRKKFFEVGVAQNSYVLAIDIRRSTDLMLKARRPEHFAAFMTDLCDQLAASVKSHFGIFDKFTGDGILAFFPEFFTGSDAGYHAVAAAHEATTIFSQCYKAHRPSFKSVLTDVGLTAGIDYGPVHLVRVADGLTVVGEPVVYACRLSTGPADRVLLNQAAFEKISTSYNRFFYIAESTLEIKHEGSMLCYDVKMGNDRLDSKLPKWASTASKRSKRRNRRTKK
jgi:adenylate cyclase